jgi:hypothetical protein
MGADKPQAEKPDTNTQNAQSLFPLMLISVVVLLVIVARFSTTDFKEGNEAPVLSPKEAAKLDKRLREIDDAEQYALIANANGWYPCNHPGRPTFYLRTGEVWKYGSTTKGQLGRYSFKFLEKMNVYYIVQFQGTISECLKEEQRKLFGYPYLPENLVRPEKDRLPRPPYNSKMQ